MSLPEPMGFWSWLRWNYQGRPDPHYVFHERTPRWYPHASLSPGGVRRAQDFDKRMRIYYEAMEWLARRERDEDPAHGRDTQWTLDGY